MRYALASRLVCVVAQRLWVTETCPSPPQPPVEAVYSTFDGLLTFQQLLCVRLLFSYGTLVPRQEVGATSQK